MNLFSWNPRGLGNSRGIHTLHDLLVKEDPEVVFIQETLLHSRRWDCLKFKFCYRNCFVVDSVGRSGGLALLWRDEVDLSILSFSKHHIHAKMKISSVEGGEIRITGVYGHPEVAHRDEVWALIESLRPTKGLPWVLFGDFNEVLYQHEKCGGRMRSERQLATFRSVVADNALRDVGFAGVPFTWNNRREGLESISKRLDHFLVNSAWCEAFPNLRVQHGVASYSDHVPLWMDTLGAVLRRNGTKMFRFEAMWLSNPKCTNIFERNWNRLNGSGSISQLMGCIKQCGEDFKIWSQNSFGNVKKELALAKKRLQQVKENDPTCQHISDHKQANEEV